MDLDLELFHRIREGDQQAFNQLFNAYYISLCGFVNAMINSPQEAEELVADLFADVWLKRKEITISKTVKGYLIVSAKNRGLGYLRKKKQFFLTFDAIPDLTTSERPDHQLHFKETKAQLTSVVSGFSTKTRSVFILSRNFKLTYKEIAGLLEISEKTVEKHMTLALKELRHQLLKK